MKEKFQNALVATIWWLAWGVFDLLGIGLVSMINNAIYLPFLNNVVVVAVIISALGFIAGKCCSALFGVIFYIVGYIQGRGDGFKEGYED